MRPPFRQPKKPHFDYKTDTDPTYMQGKKRLIDIEIQKRQLEVRKCTIPDTIDAGAPSGREAEEEEAEVSAIVSIRSRMPAANDLTTKEKVVVTLK
jgi:hypothetical protein